MRSLNDWWNRYQKGNTGTVTSWVHPTDRPDTVAPVDKLNELTLCRALVRDDGKILSTIDCWNAPNVEILKAVAFAAEGHTIQKTDGPYLVQRNKLYGL